MSEFEGDGPVLLDSDPSSDDESDVDDDDELLGVTGPP